MHSIKERAFAYMMNRIWYPVRLWRRTFGKNNDNADLDTKTNNNCISFNNDRHYFFATGKIINDSRKEYWKASPGKKKATEKKGQRKGTVKTNEVREKLRLEQFKRKNFLDESKH